MRVIKIYILIFVLVETQHAMLLSSSDEYFYPNWWHIETYILIRDSLFTEITIMTDNVFQNWENAETHPWHIIMLHLFWLLIVCMRTILHHQQFMFFLIQRFVKFSVYLLRSYDMSFTYFQYLVISYRDKYIRCVQKINYVVIVNVKK